MGENLRCKHPDRDCPKMVCGYPIPCPYHTVVLEPFAEPVGRMIIPFTADAAKSQTAKERLAAVGLAVRKRRPRP